MNAETRAPTRARAVLGLFIVLSVVLTYPLALHPAGAVEDRQDALLNVWIAAWDGHQLLADPARLFDANIFSPYRNTLAYSELLLGNALLALPITAATGNPVLGYNVALLLSFVLSGLGAYALVLKLTRRPAAGLVAGLIFGFSSYRMSNLAQAQILATQWLPFALLALHLLLEKPSARRAALFVVFFWLQAVSSFYYGILLGLVIAGATILGIGYWILRRVRGGGPTRAAARSLLLAARPFLLAACGLLLFLLPFVLPYFAVQREMGFERTLADSEPFSASLAQYGAVPPGSVLHGLWLPTEGRPQTGGYPPDALFPGIAAILLAAVGVMRGQGRARWLYLLLLLAAWCLSLGPRLYLGPGRPAGLNVTLPYAWLYAVVPGFKALRAPARFDVLATLAVAVLAGYGVAVIIGRQRQAGKPVPREAGAPDLPGKTRSTVYGLRSTLLAPAALLAAVVLLESLVWPGAKAEPVPVGTAVPPVYRWLAAQPPGAILELPMAFAEGGPRLDYQYLSAYHWQATPDGYSGFIPPERGQIAYEMERFPSERSVSLLQALGVRYVVVHRDRYPAERQAELQAAIARAPDLAPVETFGQDEVYEVQSRSFWTGDLTVSAYFPPRAATGQPYTAYAMIANHGPRSYAFSPTEQLYAEGTFANEGGVSTRSEDWLDIPLVISPNGGVAIVAVPMTVPAAWGTYDVWISYGVIEAREYLFRRSTRGGSVEVGDQASSAFPVPARLASWQVPPAAGAGKPLRVDLAWRAMGKIDAYYSVYVKLLDGRGSAVASWDGQPRGGQVPTLEWVPGETVTDTVTLDIPPETPPGEYTVEAGMYRAEDLARCLLLAEDGTLLDRAIVGQVRVEP